MSKLSEKLAKSTEACVIGTTRDAAGTADLRYGVVPARSGKATRWVVFFNGRTEWIEKYAYLPFDLRLPPDCGFLTMDHRGQGGSGGARAYVDTYDSYASDAAKVVAEQVGAAPYCILSHSMGGLIGLYATLQGKLRPEMLVLSSPLLGMPHRPVPIRVAKPLAALLRASGLGAVSSGGGTFTRKPFERNRLTHDVDLYHRMQDTPYRVPGATFGWVAASFAATEFCFRASNLANLTMPTLVLGGTDESVVDATAFRAFVDVAGQHAKAPVTLRLIPDARHELFSEIPKFYDPAVEAVREFLAPFLIKETIELRNP